MSGPALTIDDPAYFARLAEVERSHWWSLGMWRIASWWLTEALAGRRGLCALDVGCGTGMGVLRLAERPEIARAVGVEPSPVALGEARRRHIGLPLVRGTALALPFDSGQFHLVTCFDVLQHLPVGLLHQAVNELRRVLRSDGVAVIRSNAEPGAARLDHLAAVFAASGFVVRRASYANCLPALVQEFRTLGRGRIRAGHPAGGGLQIRVPRPWLNRVMRWIAAAEAYLSGRLAIRLPFGHSTMLLVQVQAVGS
jgi:ubiquinone/menaquinone biosynthesis C-methylase UbiE